MQLSESMVFILSTFIVTVFRFRITIILILTVLLGFFVFFNLFLDAFCNNEHF